MFLPPFERDRVSSQDLAPRNEASIICPKSSSNIEYTSDNNSDIYAFLLQPSEFREGVRVTHKH